MPEDRTTNQIDVVVVPLGAEMQRAMEAAQRLEAAMDAELERLLTPEGRRRLAQAEAEATRRFLFGDGA